MRHNAPVVLVSPLSTSSARPENAYQSPSRPPKQRSAEDYFGDWAHRWPSEADAERLIAQRAADQELGLASPSSFVCFSARGASVVARSTDVPACLLESDCVWGDIQVDEVGRISIYVNLEVSTLHRVLDFFRDKKVPLTLTPNEVRSLKAAAEMLADRELLEHFQCLWPVRVEARKAKGTSQYSDKLFAVANAWEQCGFVEKAQKKRYKAFDSFLKSTPLLAETLDFQLPPSLAVARQMPFFSDVGPTWNWGPLASCEEVLRETRWPSSSSDGPCMPGTPSPSHSLEGAMNFSKRLPKGVTRESL